METLLHAALSNAATAAFLALLVACLGRLLARRPAVLHCLWLLVLVKLLSPPLYQLPIPWPESLSGADHGAPAVETVLLEEIDQGESALILGNPNAVVLGDDSAARIDRGRLAGAEHISLYEQFALSVVLAGEWLASHWMPIAAMIWLVGSVATAVVCARRIYRFQLLLREARPASDEIQDHVDELAVCLGIKRSPQVFWIGGRLSPMLWAVGGRSRLIIPTDLWKGLKEQERATLIVHELAHLRRGDHYVRVFELLVTVLCWWNPVLWWARQALRDVEEQCCDAWVVWAFPEAARSYAETLLETLDFLNQSELSEPLLASGFGKVHHLRRRLTMIMSGTTPRLVSVWGGLGSLCLAVLLLPVNATWAQKPEEQKEVRVIVKTDDGSVKPDADAIEIRSADGSIIKGKIITVDVVGDVKVDAPLALSYSENILATELFEPVQDVKVQDVKQERFVIQLQDGDASVNVVAGTPEEARNQIIARLKTLKEKSSLSEQDNALLKVLEEVLEHINQSKATSAKSGSLDIVKDGKTTTDRRVVVRRMDKLTSASSNPEKKAEIGKLRDEVKKLTAQLAAAQSKLSQLEGSNVGIVHFVTPDTNVTRHIIETRPVTKTIVKTESGAKFGSPAATPGFKVVNIDPKSMKVEGITINPDHKVEFHTKVAVSDEQRIQDLEKTLKKLMEEVDSLKKARSK